MSNKAIMEVLNECQNVVIAGHTNPDGDAIGACLALAMSLKKIGKTPWVVLEDYNPRFNIIPGREFLYKGSLDDLEADTFIAVDCGNSERLGKAEIFLDKAPTTISIDHHMSNTGFAQLNYVDAMASSTCELIFRIINNSILIDVEIASALYAGMVYDSGGFRHNSTTVDTMVNASKLIALGIPFSKIYNELMFMHDLCEAKVVGRALQNLELLEGGEVAYPHILASDLAEAGANTSHLGSICEYALNTVGAKVAVFIYAKGDNLFKISFRSKTVFVNKIAEQLGGGGHEFAAGCDFAGTLEIAKEKVMNMLRPLL